jgi:hypothetical protein
LRGGQNAHRRAPADRRHGLRLGEDLGIRADADLEILRPQALLLKHAFDMRRLRRAGDQRGNAVADDGGDAGADLLGAGGVACRAFLDHALDHAAREGDAAGLDRLQVAGGQQPWVGGIAPGLAAVGGDGLQRAEVFPGMGRQPCDGIVPFQQVAHGWGLLVGHIEQVAVAQMDEAGALSVRAPDPADQGRQARRHQGWWSWVNSGHHRPAGTGASLRMIP